MTTKPRIEFVEDISAPNAVLRIAIDPRWRLSATVWTTPSLGSVAKARLACLRHALAEVTRSRLGLHVWLVGAHRANQPDNRITRYHGFWRSLTKRGFGPPPGDHFEEVHAANAGLRWFGAARLGLDDLEWGHAILSSEQAAIVVTPSPDSGRLVADVLRIGWSLRGTKPPEELLCLCEQASIVMDCYGEFDDPEASVAAIGEKAVVAGLVGRQQPI